MLTEDYLIRRINQVIALIMHALGLRKDGQLVAAQTDIDIALELLLGMRAALLKQMDDASLLGLLTVRGELDLERLDLAADLFREEAAILAAQGQAALSYADQLRALNFTLEGGLSDPGRLTSERAADVAGLAGLLDAQRLPMDTLVGLANFYQALLDLGPAALGDRGIDPGTARAELRRWSARIGG
jgi:hypothetical protein